MLEQRSRPQLFSNGVAPTVAASSRRALAELRDDSDLVASLQREHGARCASGLVAAGLEPLEGESAIVPIIVGETARGDRDQPQSCSTVAST